MNTRAAKKQRIAREPDPLSDVGVTAHLRTKGAAGAAPPSMGTQQRTEGDTESRLEQVTLDSKGRVVGATARFANDEGVAVGDHFWIRDVSKGNFEEFDKWFQAMESAKWRHKNVD